jgi:hypothetical protein
MPELRIDQSTVEIGITPERVILDVRGTHYDTEGHVFTNGVLSLNLRDLDVLLCELWAAREGARFLLPPQPGLWSHCNGGTSDVLRS